ncbi:MAG: thiamine pyrophosphate-binding protein [Rhizobiales bacterium]|nr:thiamine pyrophosphate-binding protein [Hyphomicrobiales bacterium]
MTIHGGKLLVRALNEHGVKRVFCVAGESYLPVLDGFLDYPEIDVITCRQEGGVTFMAEAYGQLTGKVGIALVTRGPGACNASIGVHSALQASTPMVLLVGLHSMDDRDKEAFQEFDLPQMFGSIAKWAAVIDDATRIPEYIMRAFHVATSGRPGPVVLGLPEEVLNAQVEDVIIKPIVKSEISPSQTQISQIVELISKAERPIILAGGGDWSDQTCANLTEFSTLSGLPVVTSFRRQDVFDHNHKNYIGELGTGPNPALVELFKNADLIFVLNARLNEISTQNYSIFNDGQTIIHVHPDADVFGRSCVPDLAIQSHVSPLCNALLEQKIDGTKWQNWCDDAHADYQKWTHIDVDSQPKRNGADMTSIYAKLQKLLPNDAIITTDAGNFSGWAQRYLRYARPGRLLAPISGAMGYSVPSAVAASIEFPDRLVLGICGDGGFMMNGQELATAMRYGAKPIIMVCNNERFGTIRMHQNMHFPDRVSATDLTNPNFVELAKSYGAFAVKVNEVHEFDAALADAIASNRLALIEITMDPEQITTRS